MKTISECIGAIKWSRYSLPSQPPPETRAYTIIVVIAFLWTANYSLSPSLSHIHIHCRPDDPKSSMIIMFDSEEKQRLQD